MVQSDMDAYSPSMKTKDFAAVGGPDGWYIAPVRLVRQMYNLDGSARMGHEDAASQWLLHEPAQGLLKQFWSHERRRFEAADEDEAYALLIHVQKTFSDRTLN